jgi:hypothetical protein
LEGPSTGCLTDDIAIVIRNPHLLPCIRGRVSLAKQMALIRSWSTAAPGFRRVFLKILDGGSPELVTQRRTWPGASFRRGDKGGNWLQINHIQRLGAGSQPVVFECLWASVPRRLPRARKWRAPPFRERVPPAWPSQLISDNGRRTIHCESGILTLARAI